MAENVYLNWLSGKALSPTTRIRWDQAQEAVAWLRKEQESAIQGAVSRLSLESIQEALDVFAKQRTLDHWLGFQARYSHSVNVREVQSWLLAQDVAIQTEWQKWFKAHQKRITTFLSADPKTRYWVGLMERHWDPQVLKAEVFVQQSTQDLEKARLDYFNPQTGPAVHVMGKVEGLHRDYLKEAKKHATERGVKGYVFPVGTDISHFLLSSGHHGKARAMAFDQAHYSPWSLEEWEVFRQGVHEKAEEAGHSNGVELSRLFGGISLSARQLRSILTGMDDVWSEMAARWFKVATLSVEKEAKESMRFPADLAFVENNVKTVQRGASSSVSDYFPWRDTAKKVFKEVLSMDGWVIEKCTSHGKDRWSLLRFELHHPVRQERALLWYAPYRVRDTDEDTSMALTTWIDEGWGAKDRRMKIITVDQNLGCGKGFEIEDLEYLCHELGHVLHFLRTQIKGPLSHLSCDFIELPSYAMEWYPSDPEVLMRWKTKRGPNKIKRRRFWERLIENRRDDLLSNVVHVKSLLFNARVYEEVNKPLLDVRQEVWGDLGEFVGMDEKVALSEMSTEAMSVAVDAAQVFSGPMVRALLGVGKKRSIKVEKVQELVFHLLDVIGKDKDSEKIAQAWRRWRGESYAVSLQKATLSYAQNVRLKFKQWAQCLEARG